MISGDFPPAVIDRGAGEVGFRVAHPDEDPLDHAIAAGMGPIAVRRRCCLEQLVFRMVPAGRARMPAAGGQLESFNLLRFCAASARITTGTAAAGGSEKKRSRETDPSQNLEKGFSCNGSVD